MTEINTYMIRPKPDSEIEKRRALVEGRISLVSLALVTLVGLYGIFGMGDSIPGRLRLTIAAMLFLYISFRLFRELIRRKHNRQAGNNNGGDTGVDSAVD